MNIYVGNLSPETTGDEIRQVFQAHGEVLRVSLLTDQMSGGRGIGPSRGIGFVIMPDKTHALAALGALHLHEIHGRAMTVQAARPTKRFFGRRR